MRRLPSFFLLGALVLVYGRFFAGFAPAGDDIVSSYMPYQMLVRDTVRSGELPYWNPMTFCGRPLMADIQTGVLYPPTWLHWVLPLPVSFTLLFLFHTGLMLWGWRRLGVAWGFSEPAACLMAILFTFSGFLTSKLQSGIILFHQTLAWFPWMALALTRLFEGPTPRRTAMLGMLMGLSILAGAPQMTYYSWLMLGGLAFILPVGAAGNGGKSIRWRTWIGFAAAVLLALALTVYQTFQTYQMTSVSFDRSSRASWEFITSGSLPLRFLGLWLTPGLFGPGADEMYFSGEGAAFSEAASYMTLWAWMVLVPAGGFALWRMGNSPNAGFHRRLFVSALILAALSQLLALGRFFPLFQAFAATIPGFSQFRIPARLTVGATAGLAVAAGVALDAWLSRARGEIGRKRNAEIAAPVMLAGVAVVLLAILYLSREQLWQRLGFPFLRSPDLAMRATFRDHLGRELGLSCLRGGVFVACAATSLVWARRAEGEGSVRLKAWILPALVALELAWVAWPSQKATRIDRYKAAFYPRTTLVETVAKSTPAGRVLWLDDLLDWRLDQNTPEIPRNALMRHGIPDSRGYDPVNARWIGTWMNRLAGLPPDRNPLGQMFVPQVEVAPWLTLMGVQTVLGYRNLSNVPGLKFTSRIVFPEGPLGVWTNTQFRGLAFAVPAGEVADDRDAAQGRSVQRALAAPHDPLGAVVLDSRIRQAGDLASEISPEFKVTPVEEGRRRFVYKTAFPAPAVLYLAQSAYPGWRVTINGAEGEALPACGTFLSTPVPKGESLVEWEYRPPRGTGVALIVSILAMLGAQGLLLRSKPETNPSPSDSEAL